MATVGLQSLLFSGFFPVEGSKSDRGIAQGSGLLGGEQLLPPAADFASMIRSAILNREVSLSPVAFEGAGEVEEALDALTRFVSDLLGRPVRLKPEGAAGDFRIHTVLPENAAIAAPSHSASVNSETGVTPEGEWFGVLLVGHAAPFEEGTPGREQNPEESLHPTIVLIAPREGELEKPTKESLKWDPTDTLPLAVPEGDAAWKKAFTSSPEVLLITSATEKPLPGPLQSKESNPLLKTFPADAEKTPVLHPRFVGAVREALAHWSARVGASMSLPSEGSSISLRAAAESSVPETLESEHASVVATTPQPEKIVLSVVSETDAVETASTPTAEAIRFASESEAAIPTPPKSVKSEAETPSMKAAFAPAPPPAESENTTKIPLKSARDAAPVIEKLNEPSVKTPEASKPTTNSDSSPKATEVRMLPVRVQVVRGEIAQRLESLAGRILETRSDQSRGATPPVAGPIVQAANWNPPLTHRPVNPTAAPPPPPPPMANGDTGVEPQPVKTSSEGTTEKPVAALTRPARSEVQVPAETAKGTPIPRPEGTVREASPQKAVEESKAPIRIQDSTASESDSESPRRIEPTPARDPIVPKAAERTIPNLPMEAPAGTPIDRSPLNLNATASPSTVHRSESLGNGAAPSVPLETENAAVEQIARTLRGRTLAQGGEIKIRLVPESLGEIHLRITIRAGQLIAEIRANSEGTREILARNTTQLQGLLAEAGSGVEKVVIRTGGFGGDLINASTAPRDPGAGGDSAEDRERTPKDRQENQSHQREQSKGNKRRFLWERFV